MNGTASSANGAGQGLTYGWTQSGGPSVTLSSATSATPGFTAPTLAMGAPDTDSRGDHVAGHDITITEAALGLGLKFPVAIETGSMTLSGGVSGT